MKKFCTLLFLFLAFTLAAVAQNAHWAYGLQNINTYTASSAVTVILSNGEAYIAHTEAGTDTIRLSEIDPTNMQATGTTYKFQNTSSKNAVVLRGGFEDLNGKIVLYGYCYDTLNYNHGYVAIVDTNNNFSNLDYFEPEGGKIVVKGCSGYDVNTNVINMFVFEEGSLFTFRQSSLIIDCSYYSGTFGYYSDVAWSGDNNCFVACGSHLNTATGMLDPFIHCFKYNPLSTPHFATSTQFAVARNSNPNCSEGKSLLSIIDGSLLSLYQDLRNDDNDIIWLTLVKNYASAPTFPVSNYFSIPLHKLSAYSMVYDKARKRLNLLGRFDYCIPPTTFIAQTEPFSLSYLNIGQIISTAGNNSCPTGTATPLFIYGNDIELNNIAFNIHSPCPTVVSTGIAKTPFGTTPYLTETYDISLASCDNPFTISPLSCYPITGTIFTQDISFPFVKNGAYALSPESTIHSNVCPDTIVCAKDLDDTEHNRMKALDSQEKKNIFVEGHNFICHGFQGQVQYEVFNAAGKLVCRGNTHNGTRNSLGAMNSGLFIVRCLDEAGGMFIIKVVVNH